MYTTTINQSANLIHVAILDRNPDTLPTSQSSSGNHRNRLRHRHFLWFLHIFIVIHISIHLLSYVQRQAFQRCRHSEQVIMTPSNSTRHNHTNNGSAPPLVLSGLMRRTSLHSCSSWIVALHPYKSTKHSFSR